jgi:hypothetical protein
VLPPELRVGPAGARHAPQRAHPVPLDAPQAHRIARQILECVEQPIEGRQSRRRIMQMAFPVSLKRTSSTRWRMRKSPRPRGFSRAKESVGSGTRR